MGTTDRLVTIAFLTQPLKTEEFKNSSQVSLLLSFHQIYVVSCSHYSAVDGKAFGCCLSLTAQRDAQTWTRAVVQLNSVLDAVTLWPHFQSWKCELKTDFWHCQRRGRILPLCLWTRLLTYETINDNTFKEEFRVFSFWWKVGCEDRTLTRICLATASYLSISNTEQTEAASLAYKHL